MLNDKEKKYCGKWRIVLGLFILSIFWAAGTVFIGILPGLAKILGILILIIFYLYMFGVLGWWLMSLDILGVINPVLRWFGYISGMIGFFLRPLPIIVYGSNKKWILNLFAGILLFVTAILIAIGVLADNDVLWSIGFYSALQGIIFSMFIFFAVKKCPNCKRVMNLIDFDSVKLKRTKYYENKEENIGYVSDGYGNTADVYANVTYERNGVDNTFAKSYTCGNCGEVKYGKKFKAISNI